MYLGLGLGLAFWKGEEQYKDVKYISANYISALYTALNNEQQNDCSQGSCSGKLVYQELKVKQQYCYGKLLFIILRFGNKK